MVARRLSDDASRRVLLLEAGPAYSAGDLGDAWHPSTEYDWGYSGNSGQRVVPVPRGRVVGGSSAVNYSVGLRSRPADHEEWARRAGQAWSWEEAARVYDKLENVWPGIPRERPALSEYGRRFRDACLDAGHEWLDDLNAPAARGAGVAPLMTVGRRRMSAGEAYLIDRDNLVIATGSHVDRVEFRGRTAVGVALADGTRIRAAETFLCAGSYGTPAILLRSGVGPEDELARCGIPPVAIRPGVGAGLIDHTTIRLPYHAPATSAIDGPLVAATLLAKSGIGDGDIDSDLDLHIHALRPALTESASVHRYSFTIGLLRPESRGGLGLGASDPLAPPRIDLNLCQREADASALARGVEIVRALAAAILGPERIELPPFAGVAGPALAPVVREAAGVYFHPMGTARMGDPAHPLAVVDETCRLIGIDQLSVVDASVIPVSLRATTNLPVTMLAERAMELRG